MKILFLLMITTSVFANYQISSDTVDGVTMTKNKEPARNCIYKGDFEFKSKISARDEKEIIRQVKLKQGNYVIESYDSYPSMVHRGQVYSCPGSAASSK